MKRIYGQHKRGQVITDHDGIWRVTSTHHHDEHGLVFSECEPVDELGGAIVASVLLISAIAWAFSVAMVGG